jgi:ubiquinone/menaquinone biosynthesis C-methylase UbiE
MNHPMLADPSHDERAEQNFTRDLKFFINREFNPGIQALGKAYEDADGGPADSFEAVESVMDRMLDHAPYRAWINMRRIQQEMMWDVQSRYVNRQEGALEAKAKIAQPLGTLRLDPDFEEPRYLTYADCHLMPGGFLADEGGVRQGALMESGGIIYQPAVYTANKPIYSRSAAAEHLAEFYPDVKPLRILEMGCGCGRAAPELKRAFPDAEVHGVDPGASLLRYAHARAENMGVEVHYSQQSGEHTDFEDGSFDLVISGGLMHESSAAAIPNFIKESRRLLRQGGVAIHSEIPHRYFDDDILGKLISEWESGFNNETSYRVAITADYRAMYEESGFSDIQIGWRRLDAKPGEPVFVNKKTVFGAYFTSGRK